MDNPQISLRLQVKALAQPRSAPPKHDEKHFSFLEMEAALCVWEHINDITLLERSDVDEKWRALRENVGSVELRHASMDIGKWCLQVYDLCQEADPNIFDFMSYDWEVIPLIFSYCLDDGAPTITPSNFPDAEKTADVIFAIIHAKQIGGQSNV